MKEIKRNIYQHQSGEKITLFLVPQKDVQTTTLRYIFDRGGVHDPPGKRGLTNLVQRLSLKKTVSYPNQYRLMHALEEKGALVEATTDKETHAFELHLSDKRFLSQALEIFHEIVYQPRFDKERLKKEINLIRQDWAQLKDTPKKWVSLLTIAKLWEGSPYALPPLGKIEDLDNITEQDLVKHHQSLRRSAHLYIGLSGNLNPTDPSLKKLIALFSELETTLVSSLASQNPNSIEQPASPRQTRFAVEQREIQQNNLWIAFPTPGKKHPDSHKIKLLSWVLGKGFLSRLFNTLRTQHSLAYDYYSDYSALRHSGVFYIYGGVPAESLSKVFTETWRQIKITQTTQLKPWELQRGLNYYLGNLARFLEQSDNLLKFLLDHYIHCDEILTFEEYRKKLSQITLEDLNQVASRIFRPNTATVGLVGPVTEREVKQAWDSALNPRSSPPFPQKK